MSAPVHVYRTRDDYGRSNLVAEQGGRELAVLVTIPKRTNHLTPGTHFINHLDSDVSMDVRWYHSAQTARAAFDVILRQYA